MILVYIVVFAALGSGYVSREQHLSTPIKFTIMSPLWLCWSLLRGLYGLGKYLRDKFDPQI